jgi:magnesium chelatase subunit I
VKAYHKNADASLSFFLMEFALHGLAEYSLISKHTLTSGLQFKDLLSSMFNLPGKDDDDPDDDEELRNNFR